MSHAEPDRSISAAANASARVRVNLGERSYDIEIGAGILDSIGEFVAERCRLTRAFIITDANVRQPYALDAAAALKSANATVEVEVVAAGEASKSVEMVNRLWNWLLDAGADRKSVVVAVGGGVVGDLAGYAAASFARGLAFVQVPTTLLAHVDSSVGGKVGVNLPKAKNMVGAFWQPRGVLIDTNTLATLPEREYRSGLAEVVKYGVILDADFFEFLEDNVTAINARHAETLAQIIARCCRLKADVVERDEFEVTGLRAVLNYGHTFGHAIEAVGKYEGLLHGEAVSIGMMCAARLAASLSRVGDAFVQRQQSLLERLGLPVATPDLDRGELLAAMSHDKKVEHGRLRFVLPAKLGCVEIVADAPRELVQRALDG